MTAVVGPPLTAPALPQDRKFYPAMATIVAALVLAGFTPSF